MRNLVLLHHRKKIVESTILYILTRQAKRSKYRKANSKVRYKDYNGMLQTEMLSLEQEKNSQFSPVSFDELSNILGGKKSVNNGNQKPTGSGGGIICWC